MTDTPKEPNVQSELHALSMRARAESDLCVDIQCKPETAAFYLRRIADELASLASLTSIPAQAGEREALDTILKAADECERCIRNDWGAAAKEELATIRRLARAALASQPVQSTPETSDAAIAIPYRVAYEIGQITSTSSAKVYEIAAHLAQHGYVSAIASRAAAQAPAEPAVQACCQDFEKCREMCVTRADYWQGQASQLTRALAGQASTQAPAEPKCPRHGIYLCVACMRGAAPAPVGVPADQAEPAGAEDINYPRDFFSALIAGNSPYAFYIFQWVPYQTDAKRWRLKMQHDVRTFDGREAFNIWPNGSSCGPFKDHEVEFIRISRSQFGEAWKDPRPNPAESADDDIAKGGE